MGWISGQIQEGIFSEIIFQRIEAGGKSRHLAARGQVGKRKSNSPQEAKGFACGAGSPPEGLVATGSVSWIVPKVSSHLYAQRALQMAEQPEFCRKSRLCSVAPEPRHDPVRGCAVELELSLRRNRGPQINNRAEAFPLEPGICSSLLANFECLSPLCGLQLCPKGKEIIRMPFMLFTVY